MTRAEFDKKWAAIRVGHDESCEKRHSFDYGLCTCGLDALWQERNVDLRSTYDESGVSS